MDKSSVNESTGWNGLNGESKAEFLRQIWNCSSYQMCLAEMSFDDSGKPVDYIILDINPAYEKAFGFTRDQAINKYVKELFPHYAFKSIEKCGEAVRLGKNLLLVEYTQEPSLWYEVQVFPLGTGDQFITMSQNAFMYKEENICAENKPTSNNITNEALINKVELLNVLLNNNPSLIFMKDECGRYVYLNKTYEKQFVGSKDWYGKTDFDFWSKESAELFRANDLAVLEAGNVTQYLEDSKNLDGTRYCWLNYKFPYTDSKNNRYTGGIGIDVTKRILAEEALRKAEEELKRNAEELKVREEEALELIDGFTEGSWIVDRIAGTIRCSEKWSKRIGLDQVPEKERLSYTHTLTHIEDTVDGNSIEHCMEMGLARFDLEYRVKTIDSGYIWTQNKGKIVYDAKGIAIKVYAATIDITERKKAEEALRKSEEKYRILFDSIDEGFCIIEVLFDNKDKPLDYRFLEVNRSFERQTGLVDAAGRCMRDMAPDHEQHWFDIYGHIALTGESARFQNPAKALGHFYDVYAFRIGEPGQRRVAILFNDISERKKAEEALHNATREAEKNALILNAVIQQMPAGVIITNKDGSEARNNEAMDRIFRRGIGSGENIHSHGYVAYHHDGIAYTKGEWPLSKSLMTGETVLNEEMNILRGDGTMGTVLVSSASVKDNCGEIIAGVVVDSEITELRQTEDALRESEKMALELVGELKKADENKNRFISVLSHELRNPLAAISAGVQLLDIAQDKNHTAKVKDVISRQMNQLCKLVDDLLELTRITQNKIKLKKEYIHLSETVKNAVDDMRLAYEKKGISLRTRIQAKPIFLSADPIRVTQIIGNLLMNALKFTQENGAVLVALKTEGNNAVISIKDNGIGISPEILPRLFTPFTQADHSLDRSLGGLGLGLSIVKGIVDLHEGSVHAHSDGLGKGSSFTIRLPLGAEDDLVAENPAIDICCGKIVKLLIIEDNRDFADLLSTMLLTIGYSVDIAYDGIEGVKLAKQIKPDVILCDIGLPGMNGFEVAQSIRNDNGIKDTRLIALTGYAGEEDSERILQAGFDKHLAKPVDFTTLKTVLSMNTTSLHDHTAVHLDEFRGRD